MKNLFFIFSLLVLPITMHAQEQLSAQPSEKMKPALLVIDIQNAYLPYMSEEDKKTALEVINGAVWTFHQSKLPVIRVYHQDLKWGPEENSDGFQFTKNVEVAGSDPKVIKHHPNAFMKTELDKILKDLNVNTVYLCGLSATGCVLATYYGAIDHEYETFMLKGGLISPDSRHTDFVEAICKSVDFDTLVFMLKQIR